MSRVAFLFPGQGSQRVGMGRSWAERYEVSARAFEEADAVLGLDLTRLAWEGPEEELKLTANTQPALLATSVAVLRALGDRVGPVAVAGHSLGEYAALVSAGALEYADALELVRRRGELMQEAVPVGVGAMAAVLGLDASAVEAVATEAAGDDVCAVANYNSPQQTVIAGHAAAVERAVALARERGAKRAMLLPVSAPFHCPLMAPARAGLEPMLQATRFADPRLPVIANVTAAPVTTGEAARDALVRQVDGAVRWVESIQRLRRDHEVEAFVEVGSGSVLVGLVRRIDPEATTLSLDGPEAVDELQRLAGTS